MVWQDFTEVLREKKPEVYKKLCEYLPDPRKSWIEEHWNAVREYPERQGKYLRPALVLLACEMLGGDVNKAVLTAAAMQASEDWLLVHDDIEDESEYRRGKPALHRIYGINVALNAGDALHMIMWKMLRDNFGSLDDKTAGRVFDKMYEVLTKTAEGQYYEESWIKYNKIEMTAEDYYRLADTKAGFYTIIGPMQLGAILAGADDSTLKKLEEFGIPLGRAFQIRDDTLNISATTEEYGKEIGGDVMEGKRTLILVHLLKNCEPKEKRRVMEIYAKKRGNKTEEDKKYVLGLMKKYKSVEHADSEAKRYGEEAAGIFKKNFPKPAGEKAKQQIMDCIEFVYKRTK